jgi:hypothetical protein
MNSPATAKQSSCAAMVRMDIRFMGLLTPLELGLRVAGSFPGLARPFRKSSGEVCSLLLCLAVRA